MTLRAKVVIWIGAGCVALAALLVVTTVSQARAVPARFAWTKPLSVDQTCTTGTLWISALPQGGFVAYDDNGKVHWYDSDGSRLTHDNLPAGTFESGSSNAAGQLLIGCSDELYLYDADAKLAWHTRIANHQQEQDVYISCVIFGNDGLIYVVINDSEVGVLDAAGDEVYRIKGKLPKYTSTIELVSNSGNIFDLTANDELVTLDAHGNELSRHAVTTDYQCDIAELPDGNILVTPLEDSMQLCSPAGDLLWEYPAATGVSLSTHGAIGYSTVAANGDILLQLGSSLSRLRSDGSLIWQCPLPGDPGFSPGRSLRPVEAPDGTIYLQVEREKFLARVMALLPDSGYVEPNCLLVAVSATGRKLWQTEIGHRFELAPSLGPEGELYGIRYLGYHSSTGFTSVREAEFFRIDPPDFSR